MTTTKRYIFWIIAFVLLVLAFVLTVLYRDDDPTGAGILSVSNIRVCEKDIYQQGPNTNQNCGNVFPDDKFLYLCGEFRYARKGFNPNVYVFMENKKYPIYYDSLPLKDSKSYCQKILLPSEDRTGNYLVKLFYMRNLIASFRFSIQ